MQSIAISLLSSLPIAIAAMGSTPALTVSSKEINAGDNVTVAWSGIGPDAITPMHVRFSSGSDDRTLWTIEPEGASSLWLGQFSPPIEKASSIHMGDNPRHRGIATEGTPPFTVPAPNKFITGEQLSSGKYTFRVTNMRAPVNWVLFSGSLTSASDFKVLAVSPIVTLRDASAPMHLRLARTSNIAQMRVSWTSAQSATEATHVVQWGTEQSRLDRATPASTHTYSAADLCGFPANESGFHAPGFFHEAVLDLPQSADAHFFYRVGSDAYGWSGVHSFRRPAAVDPHAPLSVVVTADMGEAYEDGSQYHWEEPNSLNTTVHMARMFGTADLLMHPGDLAYATGYESEWDRFMSQIEPLSSQVPYMTGMGNHERDFPGSGSTIGHGDSGGECGVPTQARFHMPVCKQPNTEPCIGTRATTHPASLAAAHSAVALGTAAARRTGPVGSADDGWYSFEQGPLHVVMVHTELSSRTASRQHTFVAADLAAVDRSRTPWVIVMGHRQMYGHCGSFCNAIQNQLDDLEPLLAQHKVDIAFWGHIHYAQRTCPMLNGTCVTHKDNAGYDAPIHAIVGNAGQRLSGFPLLRSKWSVYQAQEWGFSHVTIHNATHLTLDFYADAPLDNTAPLHHSVTITRKFPRV